MIQRTEVRIRLGPAADGGFRNQPAGREKLAAVVCTRLTPQEHADLCRLAALDGMRPGGFLRNLLLRALKRDP